MWKTLMMSKTLVWLSLGTALGVDFKHTWTCYKPAKNGKPCGLCDACRLRRRGFEAAHTLDPLDRKRR